MNRINFGRKSGVILDFCRGHGMWFDDGELPRILLWIQNGGEQRAHRLDAEQAAVEAREQRLARDADRASAGARVWSGQPIVDLDTAGDLVDLLGAGMRQLFGRW
jgi:Zn-finger nucleic acid-binding protein